MKALHLLLAPALALFTLVRTRQAFADQDLADVPTIDFDVCQGAAVLVGPAALDDADLAGRQQLFQPFLSRHAEFKLIVAFGEMDFRRIEAEQPVFDAERRMDRVAVDDTIATRALRENGEAEPPT